MPSGQASYFDAPLLGGGKPSAIGSVGSLVDPGGSSMGSTVNQKGFRDRFLDAGGGDLVGGGIGLLTSLFADNPYKQTTSDITSDLRGLAKSLTTQGEKTAAAGLDTLQPVIKYLNGLMSGNPADVANATAPERKGILDQYDTAMKTLERIAPRGGGQVSALGELEKSKASAISTTTASARARAADTSTQLGTALTGQGLSAQAYAGSDLASALQAAERQAEEQAKANKDAGEGIGALIAKGIGFALMF